MDLIERMKEKAKSMQKRLVLPEGVDLRTMKAAAGVVREGFAASVTLIGKGSEIQKIADKEGVNLEGVTIIEPEFSPDLERYANEYYELRKHKGVLPEQAKKDILDPLRWGAMMLRLNAADAFVAGADNTTGDVLRAGLAIIGTAQGIKTASSCFVMSGFDRQWGAEGSLIFSDCAVVPDPNAEQLADIAESAAQSCREFLSVEPAVAMLSFSTKGSGGDHADVKKVLEALAIVKAKEPTLMVDGEYQADTALVPSIRDKKAPGSPISGNVNTLVFPDMDAGNIGYQIARSFGKAKTYGPYLQGFAKPISYIPHGATVESIVISCAATLARAK